MDKLIIFFNQNALYFVSILAVLCALIFFFLLRTQIKLKKKTQEYCKIEEKCTSLIINESILKQRFEDATETLSKNEEQMQALQNAASGLEREYSAFKAASAVREEGLTEKIAYLEKIKEDLTLKFKDISSEIIKSQQETFSLAQKNTLSAIINPFAEQLKAFKTEVTAAREESIKNKSNLDAQLNNLATLNVTLSKDAQNLTEALKGGKKMQGNWGECQLSSISEISGLRKGQDYETQESFVNEEKKLYRPDVIVHLPENRDIIIDSKVSLTDYLDAVNTEDEDIRKKALQKNVTALKSHIDELSFKE